MVEHLLAAGPAPVIGVDLTAEKLEGIGGPDFQFYQADIRREPALLDEVVREADVVVDLIAYANPSMYVTEPLEVFDLNFMQNLEIAKLCIAHRKRLIQYSSAEVYGKSAEGERLCTRTPATASSVRSTSSAGSTPPPRCCSSGCSYAHGAAGDLEFTIIRPFNFIGSRIDYLVPANAIGGPAGLPAFHLGPAHRRAPAPGGRRSRAPRLLHIDGRQRRVPDDSGPSGRDPESDLQRRQPGEQLDDP